jgi:dimethylaniline monooxygenase (N-oxide forming)
MENKNDLKDKKLVIIGAGISGLVSAKYALETGFTDITIFDAKKSLGGNWNEENSPMWKNLSSNLSKFSMQFSDFHWKEYDEVFAKKKEINHFLEKYAENFNIVPYLNFETKVINISKIKNPKNENYEKYKLKIQQKDEEPKFFEFDYVIVGVGFLTTPDYSLFEKYKIPESKCKVEIFHASNFKDTNYFKNKRVIVIGQAHSSTQIAVKISKCAEEVLNVFRKPSHVIPKRIYSEKYKKEIPYDFLLSKFIVETEEENIAGSKLPEKEVCKIKNNAFNKLLFPDYEGKGNKYNEDYNNIPEILQVGKDCDYGVAIGISDGYYKAIHKGTIKPIKSEIKNIREKTVELTNGEIYEDIDVVILGTGYKCNLSFLDEEISEIINYQIDNKYAPTNIVLDVFHPNLKNLAFVGIHYFLVFGLYELQARLALRYFSDYDTLVNKKNQLCVSGFSGNKPYHFMEYTNKIAMLIDSYPKLDEIKQNDEELYNCITEGPPLMEIFWINTPKKEKFVNYIKKINRVLNSDNNI